MKKFVSVLLIVCLLLGLCGCHPSTIGVPTDYGKEPTGDSNVGENDHIDPNPGYTGNVRDDAHCAAPTYMKEIPFLPKYVRTDGGREGVEFPTVILIHSVEELEQYVTENREYFDLEHRDAINADSEPGFMDYCMFYDEAFFEKQYLVMILVEEGSGSIRHNVSHVGVSGDGILYINLQTVTPDVGTDDMAQWHILVELEKEYDVKYAENVRLGGRNYGEKHTLELAGSSEFILDTIPKIYNAGEIVRIRTEILLDADIVLYLNGVRLDRPIEVGIAPEGSTEDITCWEFAFVMPDEDSTLLLQVESGDVEPLYDPMYYCPELGETSPILFLSEETGKFMMTRTMYHSSIYLGGTFTWEDDRLILTESMESNNAFYMVFDLNGKDLIVNEAESTWMAEPFVDGMILQLWPIRDEDMPIGTVYLDPPEMKMAVDGYSTPGILGEYIWTVYQGDVENNLAHTTQSDVDMQTIFLAGAVSKFEVYGPKGELHFGGDYPNEVTVRRWTADGWGDPNAYTEVAMTDRAVLLEQGMYIYEVMATWERENYQGTACYYFLVECWAALPEEPDADRDNDDDSTSDTRPGDNEFLCEVTRLSDGRVRYPATVDSETLRDFLHSLSYDSDLCRCAAEYKIDDGYGNQFTANLTEGYVRFGGRQAMLTEDQFKILYDLIA